MGNKYKIVKREDIPAKSFNDGNNSCKTSNRDKNEIFEYVFRRLNGDLDDGDVKEFPACSNTYEASKKASNIRAWLKVNFSSMLKDVSVTARGCHVYVDLVDGGFSEEDMDD